MMVQRDEALEMESAILGTLECHAEVLGGYLRALRARMEHGRGIDRETATCAAACLADMHQLASRLLLCVPRCP